MPDIAAPAYHPEKRSVGELLVMTNPAIIVPDWQRNYSWKTEHIEAFWNDLMKFSERVGDPIKEEYFFGSVVLVSGTDERLLLLDGQQRLATSSILLSAIRNALQSLDAESADWIQENYLANYDPINERHIHKLRLNIYDREFFERLVSQKRDEGYVEPEAEHASHRLILNAKSLFDREITGRAADVGAEAKNWLKRLVKILTSHFTVIAAYSDNEDDAAEVFETLNDRGIGLSTPDLLRNLVIRRAAEGQRDLIVERWENVISFDSDNKIKAFLRHFWISEYGDVKTQSLYREVKSTVEGKDLDSLVLSTALSDAAKLYRSLLAADVDDEATEEMLEAIGSFGAGANILFPALLSIFKTLDEEGIRTGLRALLNMYVRDSIIGQIENSVLENRIYRAARNLHASRDLAAFCSDLSAGALTNDEVRGRFERLVLRHNGQRRYLLYNLEMAKRATEELEVAAPSKVHVEHIYPQTPEAGQRLASHDRVINRMGNLTLLSRRINSAIKNGTFAAKKQYYETSEILLTKELCAQDEWNEEKIGIRQANLANQVAAIWPLISA
ncbi:DUF262 domain-containing protein [Roseibium album]|uniref:DUF262 domain-containing protein n=1 Tax=Roseibium album TaxID=311410 RepID=UPI00249162B5|nr:DUF262 domain-containing HNH endonuclease family protein [Roseibium album]